MFKQHKIEGKSFAFLGLLFGLAIQLLIYQLTVKTESLSFFSFLNLSSLHRLYAASMLLISTLAGLITGQVYSSYKEQKKKVNYLQHDRDNYKNLSQSTAAELEKLKQATNQDSSLFVANWDELVTEKERYREEADIASALLKVALNISTLSEPKKALKILSQALPVVLYADDCLIFFQEPNEDFKLKDVVLDKNQPAIKKILKQKQPLAINNKDRESLLSADIIRQLKLQSALFIPCLTKTNLIALAAVLYTKSPFELGAKEVKIAKGLVEQITVVLENAKLYQEVIAQHQELQQLMEKLALAQEDERRRIARDLHDSVIQDLSGIIFSLSFLQNALPETKNKRALNEISQLTKVVEASIQDIRQIIYDLRPTTLDSLGLMPTLEKYLERFAAKNQVAVEIKSNLKERLPEKIETTVFRLTQEALNNIAKYAQAKKVTLKVNADKKHLELVVLDDGIGFNLSEVKSRNSQTSGFGLSGMKERVRLVGGKLEISTSPGKGCQIAAIIPLKEGELVASLNQAAFKPATSEKA